VTGLALRSRLPITVANQSLSPITVTVFLTKATKRGGSMAALRPDGRFKASAVPLILLAAMLPLSACAAPAGLALFSASTGIAMGTSVDYTLNGIAYKTFVSPLPTVRQATLSGLNRMGIKVVHDKKSDTGWTIAATADGREIDIDLERLTGRTTRMRVVATNSVIFKDRATEAAIIDEAADMLDHRSSARS
jgi:hypothetical protein